MVPFEMHLDKGWLPNHLTK